MILRTLVPSHRHNTGVMQTIIIPWSSGHADQGRTSRLRTAVLVRHAPSALILGILAGPFAKMASSGTTQVLLSYALLLHQSHQHTGSSENQEPQTARKKTEHLGHKKQRKRSFKVASGLGEGGREEHNP